MEGGSGPDLDPAGPISTGHHRNKAKILGRNKYWDQVILYMSGNYPSRDFMRIVVQDKMICNWLPDEASNGRINTEVINDGV